jgi:hypothetical protein
VTAQRSLFAPPGVHDSRPPAQCVDGLAQLSRIGLGLALGDLRCLGLVLGSRKLGLGVRQLGNQPFEAFAQPVCPDSLGFQARSARFSA